MRKQKKKEKTVVHFHFGTPCCCSEKTATDHTQAGVELSTQESAKVHEWEWRTIKIKLHKIICEYIYNCIFRSLNTVMLHQSKAFPFVCSISQDMQVPLLFIYFFYLEVDVSPIHHIPLALRRHSLIFLNQKWTKNIAATWHFYSYHITQGISGSMITAPQSAHHWTIYIITLIVSKKW